MTEKVGVLVGTRDFEFWSELELTLSLDTFATLSFKAPFEPDSKDFRQTFRPFSFSPLKVLLDGSTLFTGCLVGVHPQAAAAERKVEITGYALPGVLDDCNAPGSSLPHEFKKVSLKQIAEALVGPFALNVRFQDDIGKAFTKAKLDEEEKLLAFLTELAQQRKLVWTSDADGGLLCWKSVQTGNPVASISDAEQPIVKVEGKFSPQEAFSEVTGFGRSRRRHRGGKHTEKNPFMPGGVLRPHSYKPPDTEPADLEDATKAQLGRMFANMACWTIDDLPTWRDPQGELWQPNTTINVLAPTAMIYRQSELLIRSVRLKQDKDKESATLEVVLPGAFSGEIPPFMPWEDPPDDF